ncbi:MAG: Ppx/GppA phosphatase family protein [Bauldia sp.]
MNYPRASAGSRGLQAPGRLDGGGPIAVIDIGSNSVRLVVYERLTRAPTSLFNEKALCGLGRGIATTGELDPAAVDEALSAIRRFRRLLDQLKVSDVAVLATAAPREAKNGPAFLRSVADIVGVAPTLLSGPQEARLSAFGVVSGFREADGVAGDLGGGSLELIDIKGTTLGPGESYPLGGIRLEESAGKAVRQAEKIVAGLLQNSAVLKAAKGRTFYAVGGTWRSLARLHMAQRGYPLRIMHHHSMSGEEALEFCKAVAKQDVDTLPAIDAVAKARRALLPYGAAVLEHVVRVMQPALVTHSVQGVREGYLFDRLDADERSRDPLVAACEELAYLRSRSPAAMAELGPWAGEAFAALGLKETAEEVRLRTAACLLSDISWRAHPDYRGEQSLDLIAYGAFVGIDHPGRAYLALANYYRHVGLGSDVHAPWLREIATPRYLERAKVLGAILRVAYLLSAAEAKILPRVTLESRGKVLTLALPKDLAELGSERVLHRLQQLGKLVGMEGALRVA